MPSVATLLFELRKHFRTKVHMLYSSGIFCSAIENKSAWFDCFVFPTTVLTWRGEPEFFCKVSSLLFWIWVHCCKILSFLLIDNSFCFIVAMVRGNIKWQACWGVQNQRHDAIGAVTKGWRSVKVGIGGGNMSYLNWTFKVLPGMKTNCDVTQAI